MRETCSDMHDATTIRFCYMYMYVVSRACKDRNQGSMTVLNLLPLPPHALRDMYTYMETYLLRFDAARTATIVTSGVLSAGARALVTWCVAGPGLGGSKLCGSKLCEHTRRTCIVVSNQALPAASLEVKELEWQ